MIGGLISYRNYKFNNYQDLELKINSIPSEKMQREIINIKRLLLTLSITFKWEISWYLQCQTFGKGFSQGGLKIIIEVFIAFKRL